MHLPRDYWDYCATPVVCICIYIYKIIFKIKIKEVEVECYWIDYVLQRRMYWKIHWKRRPNFHSLQNKWLQKHLQEIWFRLWLRIKCCIINFTRWPKFTVDDKLLIDLEEEWRARPSHIVIHTKPPWNFNWFIVKKFATTIPNPSSVVKKEIYIYID